MSLGLVHAYNVSFEPWSMAEIHSTVWVDKDSNGSWPHAVFPSGDHPIFGKSISSGGRPLSSAPLRHDATHHLDPPPDMTPIEKVLDTSIGNHLSNITIYAYGCGAPEALPPDLQFLAPFTRNLKIPNLKVPPPSHDRNLLSWVQLIVNPAKILEMQIDAIMTVNNTFNASISIDSAVGDVYVGANNYETLLGTVSTSFDPPFWAGGLSVTKSPVISGQLLLDDCKNHPWDCAGVLAMWSG